MLFPLKKKLNGIQLPHRAHTMTMATEQMPVSPQLSIVMNQHIGAACHVMVKPGDSVKMGQVIGSSDALLSVPIHASASGQVSKIDTIIMPNGVRTQAVIIDTDEEQQPVEGLAPPVIRDKKDFINAVQTAGLVGLGGAGFPTYVKFMTSAKIDTLIINAAECEPYVTADYHAMMEDTDEIMAGIEAVLCALDIPACIIAIEEDKPQAIETMRKASGQDGRISVHVLTQRYPQGAEKVMVYETLGRTVPEGKLPSDVGVIVNNITTIAGIARYLKTGIPLVRKRITVDGSAVVQPKTLDVPIGTSIKDILMYCGGFQTEPAKILLGGPMMGHAVYDIHYPIMKNHNALLAFDSKDSRAFDVQPCILCGRCMRACPMELMPMKMEDAFLRDSVADLQAYHVNTCIECGSCSYVCPSRRNLVQSHRLSKVRLKNQ